MVLQNKSFIDCFLRDKTGFFQYVLESIHKIYHRTPNAAIFIFKGYFYVEPTTFLSTNWQKSYP